MNLLQTSPLLILRAAGQSTVAGRPLHMRLSLDEIEMLTLFSEPTSMDEGIESGFNRGMIEGAIRQGLLVECDGDGARHGSG
jgi:hypothetical protein